MNNNTVYMFEALRRTKDNPGLPHRCIRYVHPTTFAPVQILKNLVGNQEGVWRIYRSVNERDINKAKKWLLHKLIDTHEMDHKIDSLWYTVLMQPENRKGRSFLVDVDTKDVGKVKEVTGLLSLMGILETAVTPNIQN